MDDPSLDAAYALKSPEDNRRLYAAWAATYDSDFAARMAYRLPDLVAGAFVEAGGRGPVLDAGAGTGLLGMALAARGIGPVDGVDLSPEMLAAARAKGIYRHLAGADLTQALSPPAPAYAGIVSSGTFTHGHVGPVGLLHLLAVLEPGGVLAASVNAQVWQAGGFAAVLDALLSAPGVPPLRPAGGGSAAQAGPAIRDLSIREEAIYADAPDAAHRADTALIVTFRRR